ncbi:DUF4332 domain-containing protein [Ornatilinea apprima]|uniref:DUF4332 domain-containing protein n=1 Tax=Ornatilinea apprima TaxID=1134406 RepID=UPI0009463F5F|nr:DUF4332 domain-containing protein [Ornatilinea apprima]
MKKMIKTMKRTVYFFAAGFGLYVVIKQLIEQQKEGWPSLSTSPRQQSRLQEIKIAPTAPQTPVTPDNLKQVEGIGPKIEIILNSAGINTFQQLSECNRSELEIILKKAGIRLADPQTWPNQARLAANGEWEQLKSYQATLKGGKVISE